jgi:hypothetical protein
MKITKDYIKQLITEELNKSLNQNRMEEPISAGVNGKNYRFKLKDWVENAQRYPVEDLDPHIFASQLKGVKEDPAERESRIENADLQYPIIIVKHGGGYMIVDGTHRIRKAIRMGVPVKAHVIPFEDLPSFKKDKSQ